MQAKLRETVSVFDFMTAAQITDVQSRAGTVDVTAAIQDGINALSTSGGTLLFPSGVYKTDGAVTLTSNLTLRGESGTVLQPSALVPLWAYRGLSVSNVKIQDIVFEGTGTAYSNGNQVLLQLSSATGVDISGCVFKKARVAGAQIADSTAVQINNCDFRNNYLYGADVRDSSAVSIASSVFELNGSTGSATSAFGRGVVLWRTSNATLSNCAFHQNTEYGLRLYSESGDTSANRNITITGCVFRDNGTTASGKIDLYVYDDAKLIERVAISGCTFSTRNGNTSAVLSGREISLSGCVLKAITPQTGTGVSLYGSTNVAVTGNVFQGFSAVASYAITPGAVSTNCTLSNNQCVDIVTFANIAGTGHIISDNYAKHGGAGTTDVGVTATNSGINAFISNNVFDGFYRGFNVATTGAVVLFKGNTTINSTSTGFFAQYQTDASNIVCTNNSFDSAYPSVWATMFSDSKHSFGRKFWVANSTPVDGGVNGGSTIAWKVGDRVFNSAPAVGQPKSWVCTVAGTPGTWVSEGNL